MALLLCVGMTCKALASDGPLADARARAQLNAALDALALMAQAPPLRMGFLPADPRAAVRARILEQAIGSELAARVATLSGEIRRAQRVARRARAFGFIAPIEGPVQTRFGDRLAGGGRAVGVELGGAAGSAVVSPAPAVVAFVGEVGGWGRVVILRGPGAYHFVLAGLGAVEAARGQTLAAGARLGSMPDRGSARLYFQIRLGDRPVDPLPLLRRSAKAAHR